MTTSISTRPALPARPRPTTSRRVAVIGGGASSEHDVSLASSAAVAAALDRSRFDVIELTLERDGRWTDGTGRQLTLAQSVRILAGCDVAVPMLHGRQGEDGTIAALLDLTRIPYVGSGVGAGALAMDKWASKLLAQSLGITIAPAVLLTPDTAPGYVWDRPVVVKPVNGGSSHGVALARSGPELRRALAAAFGFDERVLVEDMVTGREIDIPVLRTAAGEIRTGPAVEIVTDGLFDTAAKYGGAVDFRIPATLALADRDALRSAAVSMFTALGCRGVARVDFFLTDAGPVFNEVNTTPGFTGGSQVPLSFAMDGLSFAELVDELVRGALGDESPRSSGPAAANSAVPTRKTDND